MKKLLEILEKSIRKEYKNFAEAVEDLRKLNLPYEEQEKYEILLQKQLGSDEKVHHGHKVFFESILNGNYFVILQNTIEMVREGLYSVQISQELYDKYALSPTLIAYFINESLSIVRMNTLAPEEIAQIGEAYHKIAVNLKRKGIKTKPEIDIEEDEINATDVARVDVEYN
jgi:hypothetical protein